MHTGTPSSRLFVPAHSLKLACLAAGVAALTTAFAPRDRADADEDSVRGLNLGLRR